MTATPSCAARGATSSIARGSPSSRTQSSAIAPEFSLGKLKHGRHRPSTLKEQRNGWHRRQSIEREQVLRVWDGERAKRQCALPPQTQWLAAGYEDCQAGCFRQQRSNVSRGRKDLLEVVEDQQQVGATGRTL